VTAARVLLAGTVAALLAGCADGNAPSGPASDQLHRDMQVLASAAAGHRYGAAADALAALEADAAAARAAGTLTSVQIQQIRAAVDRVQADLAAATSRPAPTVTVTAPSTPRRPSPSKPPGGKDKGHGHGGD
jgi:hypothetical protein